MAQIKNIIFDLGGVLLTLDYHSVPKSFMALGFENFDEVYSQAKQSDLFNKFETGSISAKEFRKRIRGEKLNISDSEIDRCWNSIILSFSQATLDYLRELKESYTLYLLRNTNEIHIKDFVQKIEDSVGHKNYCDVFEKIYYSNEIGFRKPDTACFDFVIQENQLNRNETLFIDDTEKNIEGAKKAKIETFLYPQNEGLRETLTDVLAQFD